MSTNNPLLQNENKQQSFNTDIDPTVLPLLLWRRLLLAVFLLLMAFGCYQFSDTMLPQLDERASAYFIDTSQKAVVSYALVRSANAVVSVIQESELQLSPTGVGVNIAVGQILDPLNDMLERVSSVLVVALVSIGVQRAALEISSNIILQAAAALFLLAFVALTFGGTGSEALRWLLRAAIILFLLRFALPVSALVYDHAYQRIFAPQIEQAETILKVIPSPRQFALQYNPSTSASNNGFFASIIPDIIRNQANDAEEKIRWLHQSFGLVMKHASSLIDALVQLASTYVTIFILQIIILPLLAWWLILGASKIIADGCAQSVTLLKLR